MPPRRTTKKRETRMDAAVDAMSPMGFPKPLVRTAVNNLLKVYGPEGWVFIEGDAYKVLIEALLGEGDQNQANGSAQQCLQSRLLDDPMEDNQGDHHNEASTSGCSNRTLLPCTNAETSADAVLTNQVFDTASASSQTGNNELSTRAADSVLAIGETGDQLPIMSVDTPSALVSKPVNQLPVMNTVDVISADYEFDCEPAKSPTIDAPQPVKRCKIAKSPPQTKAPKPKEKCNTANSLLPPPPPPPTAPKLVERLGRQRRRPCYGWFSDDDEEMKLIELPPASLSQVLSMFVNGNDWVK